ncbi:MAG: UDP-N-acetylmuramoyl-L-alanyl-D-glutamate--2,6-diaminopimelate ligase [Faecousia sp.]
MLLSKIVSKIPYTCTTSDRCKRTEITNLCYNSRSAGQDTLFVCLTGANVDGHHYAADAYERGCRAFLCERELDLSGDAIQIITGDTRKALALASAEFFKNPAKELTIIGVTGTAGKTTVALLTQQLLLQNGINAGYIGSNGVQFGDESYHTANTTPESYELHRYFRRMRESGVTVVVLEVSSQALYLNRVYGIPFHICVFTNLGLDHVDEHEHPTFEHYRDTKRSLFRDYGCRYLVYNGDDPWHEYMLRGCSAEKKISFGLTADCDFRAENWENTVYSGTYGSAFDLISGGETNRVRMAFPGTYNISNAMAAMAVCSCMGIPVQKLIPPMETAAVTGRFEQVKLMPDAVFIIDYAHNGISLQAALETIRGYAPKRVVCLFGSVGGRTQSRRAELGAVAARLADECVLTADNPNFEPPEAVIEDIAAAMEGGACRVVKIPDRAEAVEYVVRNARPGDAVLLAGKGHEDYQLIRGKKLPFCERELLLQAADKYLQIQV